MDAGVIGACIDHGRKGLPKLPYALMRVNGKCEYIHRNTYAVHNGKSMEDLKGVHIMHTCDNPRCINPLHLVAGTNASNMRDKALKRRAPAKLTDEQVLMIRATVFTRANTQSDLAKQLGVDASHISKISSNKHCTYAEERMGLFHSI
jgi:hypothetical protein